MNYFIVLTDKCDLTCSYCRGKVVGDKAGNPSNPSNPSNYSDEIEFLPSEISYETWKLERFCRRDPDCGLIFYGGEPLLRIGKIIEIMERIPAKRFILQTNALKLHDLPPKYVKMLNGIQISIDGDKPLTDANRGKGVYDSCISNASIARERGFSGELIARMTVTEDTDIYKQVMHLLTLGRSQLFDAVHWQLDSMFAPDYEKRQFAKWVKESYNPGVTRLAEKWIDGLKKCRVMRIYPFLGIMQSLLNHKEAKLRCGAGYAHYAIQTDGNIVPCPVMTGMKRFYAGNLSTDPKLLKQFNVKEPCIKCDIKSICGGRCLYANVHDFWGEKGYTEVCYTVNHLVNTLKKIEPDVRYLIEKNKITLKDLEYTKYNSCEIIP